MKILCLILLTVTFVASNINAQTKTFEDIQKENNALDKKVRCRVSYDKFKDTTYVFTQSSLVGNLLYSIDAAFAFKGQVLQEPVEFYSVFFSTPRLLDNSSFIFIAGDERVNIGKTVNSNEPVTNSYGLRRYQHQYVFTPDQFEKFVNANGVEFQVGTGEHSMKKENSDKLKSLIILSKSK